MRCAVKGVRGETTVQSRFKRFKRGNDCAVTRHKRGDDCAVKA